jgi:predicted MFS family arabinose efflux permease
MNNRCFQNWSFGWKNALKCFKQHLRIHYTKKASHYEKAGIAMIKILIVFGLHFIRFGIIFPIIPLVAHDVGASAVMIGFVVSAFSMLGCLLGIPIGGLTDRLGVKHILAIGVTINLLSSIILVCSHNLLGLTVSQLLGGVGFVFHPVAAQTYISRLNQVRQREMGFSFLALTASIGQATGPPLGGFLLSVWGLQSAFATALGIAALACVALLGVEKDQPPQSVSPYRIRESYRQTRQLLVNPQRVAVLIFTFVITFTASLRTSFLPVLLDSRGFSESRIGMLIGLFGLAVLSIRLFAGHILGLLQRRHLIAMVSLAIFSSITLIPFSTTLNGIMPCIIVFGFGFGLFQPLSMVMISDLAAADISGINMGLRITVLMLATIMGPLTMGIIVHYTNLSGAFFATAGLVLITATYILVIKPELLPVRREERAER